MFEKNSLFLIKQSTSTSSPLPLREVDTDRDFLFEMRLRESFFLVGGVVDVGRLSSATTKNEKVLEK